jgi:hypothetical protein
VNIGLTGVALMLVWSMSLRSGRIEKEDGLGYDGVGYAAMVIRSFEDGNPNQQLRPLVLAFNQLAYDRVFHDPRDEGAELKTRDVIRTFEAMNYVWTGLLAFVLCAILDQYAVSAVHKLIFVANVFSTIAVAKMFVFYPVLIDVGAYFWLSLAVWAIVRGGRPLILITLVLAVLARELGLMVALAGIHRDLRRRVPLMTTALTYLPAIVGFFALRQWVLATSDRSGAVLDWLDVLTNMLDLLNPIFLAFFTYFTLTVFGGISLVLICAGLRGRLNAWGEPEWLTLAGTVFGVTLFGSLDVWRYLAYALPAVAILYARGPAQYDWRLALPWAAAVTAITQQPWSAVTDEQYFTDWFPLYRAMWHLPEPPAFEFWPLWGLRFAIVAAFVVAAWAIRWPAEARQV